MLAVRAEKGTTHPRVRRTITRRRMRSNETWLVAVGLLLTCSCERALKAMVDHEPPNASASAGAKLPVDVDAALRWMLGQGPDPWRE